MNKDMKWYDLITININWFSLTARAQTLSPLIIPLLIQQFVGEELQGRYYGIARLWALMLAILVQAFIGILSDKSRFLLGRRRPFIIIGALSEILVLFLIGLSINLEGFSGYWIIFILYILSMGASNTSHAATLGLIPDLVERSKRGIFSGVKSLFELPLPLIFVSLVTGKQVAEGNVRGALISVSLILLTGMLISLFIQEKPRKGNSSSNDMQDFMRLISMTIVFTTIILVLGKLVDITTNMIRIQTPEFNLFFSGIIIISGISITILVGISTSLKIGLKGEREDNNNFRWWVINRLAFLVGAANLGGFLIFFLQERFVEFQAEKAAGPAANIALLVGVFIIVSAIPAGWMTDRFGEKPIIGLSGIICFLGSALIYFSSTLTNIYVGAGIIGIGVGLFYTSNWALGTQIVPHEKAGQYLGLSNLAGAGAGAIGAYIGGPIGDKVGYSLLIAVYGFLFLLSIIPLFRIDLRKLHTNIP